ncbi:MAG: DUF3048 domain-containing protein [Actinomycetota bacterium]
MEHRRTRPPSLTRTGTPGPLTASLVAVALLAAACGSGEDTTDAADDADLAFAESASEGEPTELDATTSTTSAEVDEVAELPVVGEPSDRGTTPTTAGSGLPPVAVGTPDPGGDPDRIYRGTIGTLGPDEILAPGAAAPPDAVAGVEPLTGLAGTVPTRPAAVVKIDNGSAADPHTGLNAADLVIEEEVEGGVTRFAAVFHSTPSIVGPVRSGRTTDVALISGLGEPLLLYSGANAITQQILVAQPGIELRSEGWSTGYWRDPTRRAPSNLYTDTAPHWASATGDNPPPQFHYRGAGESADGAEVDELSVLYPSSIARWVWDGRAWLRWQRGGEHLLVGGEQVSAANVVVIEADEIDTGMVDAGGGAVPEFLFVGSGRATVFTDGRRIEGTWTRPTLTSVATLTEGPGRPIELTPGRTWIQLVETGSNAVAFS